VNADAPTITRRHKARANVALELGRYEVAERESRAALAATPRDLDAMLFLSRALLGQGRHPEAIDAAQDAVSVAPADGYAHYLLGFALQVSGQPREAIASLREAVRLQPRASRYHARLAIALIESGAKEEALQVIEAIALVTTEDALLADECARVFSALGAHARAQLFASRALTLRPSDPSTHWRLAWVLANARQFREAAASATAALELAPNYWAAWEELGYAMFELRKQGEPGAEQEAEASLNEALRLKPGLRSAAFNLAVLYRAQGRLARAERVCDEALFVDPKHEQLARIRDSLREEREARERARREQTAVLVLASAVSLLSAWTARSIGTLVLSALAGVAAILSLAIMLRPERLDEDPPPQPRLLRRSSRLASNPEADGEPR
jgi:tetratricopeptide (TPR) repeat protein